jgi:hypothetical protein
LFADIKGSMDLIENLDPEEARTLIDPALKLMMDAVLITAAVTYARRRYPQKLHVFDVTDLGAHATREGNRAGARARPVAGGRLPYL